MLQAAALSNTARAISILQGDDPFADREWASQIIVDVLDSCVRTICRSWGSNRLLMTVCELNDVAQESRVVILTRVMRGFRIPEDAEDQDSIGRALHRYARRILNNHWIDVLRSLARDGTKRPYCGEAAWGGSRSGRSFEAVLGSTSRVKSILGNLDHGGSEKVSAIESVTGFDGSKEIEDAAAESEMLGQMKGALTEENFNILYLRYQGLTTAEIGAVVGLTRKAVNERIRFRIKPVLAPRLRRQGFQVP